MPCEASPAKQSKEQLEVPIPVSNDSECPYPEGGLNAWLTVAGGWLIQFCTFGYLNAFGVYQDFYLRTYFTDRSSADISWIGSLQLLFCFGLGVFTGPAYDRGYFRHLVATGSFLFVLSLFLLSVSSQYYQVFLCQGLLQGIGAGICFVPAISIPAHYFRRKRALAMGIVMSGSSLGGVVHPIMLNQLFHTSVGFHRGVRYSATMVLVLMLLGNLMTKPCRPPRNVSGLFIGAKTFMKDVPYVLSVTGGTFISLGLFFPIFFLQVYSVKEGASEQFAFYTLTIMNACSTFGRIAPNAASSIVGPFDMMVFCTLGCAIMVFSLFGVTSVPSIAAFAGLYGFFSGGVISLVSPTMIALSKDFSEVGTRMGICYSVRSVASLFGTPITGLLLTGSLQWWRGIVFSGGTLASGALFYGIARITFARRRNEYSGYR